MPMEGMDVDARPSNRRGHRRSSHSSSPSAVIVSPLSLYFKLTPMIILYIVLGLIALILVLASLKPNTLNYTRSATISAPAERIFPVINDFHEWPKWSPW